MPMEPHYSDFQIMPPPLLHSLLGKVSYLGQFLLSQAINNFIRNSFSVVHFTIIAGLFLSHLCKYARTLISHLQFLLIFCNVTVFLNIRI